MKPAGVMVLGVTGMLGHKVFQRLRGGMHGTIGLARGDRATEPAASIPLLAGDDVLWGVDVRDFGALGALLESRRPMVLVNCVGIVKQRSEAKAAVPSITVNSLLPHWLAERLEKWDGRLIHFSTDCVFSGRKGMYTEEDPTDAVDLYGKTKALGEVTTPNALTLRTSIIGRELTEHRSLLDWFLSQKGKKVLGFRKVIYSGTTTNEMANAVSLIIRSFPALSGLFQVVSDPISKCDLLLLIREAYGLKIDVEPDDREVSDRSMCGEKFHKATGWRSPSWPDMVRTLATDPTPYEAWGVSVR